MQQAVLGATVADHRLAIGQVTFGAAPGTNRLGAFQKWIQLDGLAQDLDHRVLAWAGAGTVEGKTLATAEYAIAARDLAGINAATLDAGAGIHHPWQGFGDEHGRVAGMHRHRLAELLGELATREIRVTRFVRVACPARGTTLASGRLDRWLSMLNFLAGKALGESPFADGLEFLLAVVKERTDPRTLPGLEAMMPGSALTRLLHHPELVTRADLSVIAGDVEGASPWQKIKLLVTDWFYGADHDLVVNTGAMSGGLRRTEGGARFRLDRGAQVNHFSYFRNADSVGWLLAGLTRGDHEDGGFRPLAEAPQTPPRWREAVVMGVALSSNWKTSLPPPQTKYRASASTVFDFSPRYWLTCEVMPVASRMGVAVLLPVPVVAPP